MTIASKIMAYDNVYAEQVGFIRKPSKKGAMTCLHMAGDEFCGNACMSLAAYVAYSDGVNQSEQKEVIIETSGTNHLVACQVQISSDRYFCQICMPVPDAIEERILSYEGSELAVVIVRYPNFIHIVLDTQEVNDEARRRAQSLAKLLGIMLGMKMIGVLLYNTSTQELNPLIYLPFLDSMVWERGCGSGTATVGAYLAWKQQESINATVKQPGGTIQVRATFDNEDVTQITIEGTVQIVAEGKAFIEY